MKPQLRNITLGDIMACACDLRDEEWEQIVQFGGLRDVDSLIVHAHGLPGPKWAFVDDADHAIAVGGYVPFSTTTYRIWMLPTARGWRDYGKAITAMAAQQNKVMLDSGAQRLETVCLSSRERAHRWYTTIGMHRESTLKRYCIDGSDAAMFVQLNGVQ